jgi:hypothetical protein
VRLGGRWFEEPVRRAVYAASRLLDEPACAAVLDEFRDLRGRALRTRLEELGLQAPAYVRLVLFYDGSNDAPCRRPRTYAFTAPGSRVVRACPSLGRLAAAAPHEAQVVVIHEVLHTLGLGEDPPPSDVITALVERRCRPRRPQVAGRGAARRAVLAGRPVAAGPLAAARIRPPTT